MLNFEVNPSSVMTGESVVALIFAVIVFIVIPIALAVAEFRITKKQQKSGLYLLLGAFASAVLLGIYSLFVGLLLLIVYMVASPIYKKNSQAGENSVQ